MIFSKREGIQKMNLGKFGKNTFSKIVKKIGDSSSDIVELTKEQESILEKNLVWLFAFPRSGTQWIGTRLLSFNTLISHGPSIGIHLGSLLGGMENNFLRNIEHKKAEPGYFFSDKYSKTWQHYLRKLILNRYFSEFHDLSKKIIIPDPEGSEGADILSQCFPNSKIIILLRDGRDSVDSVIDSFQKDSWWTKKEGLNPPSDNSSLITINRASKRWVKRMEILMRAYENHPKELRLKIKYEDIRKNTLKEISEIYNFIGIKISQVKLEEIVEKYSFEKIPSKQKGAKKVTRSANPGKWKENFNEEEKKLMQEIMGKTLQKLGY